MNKDIIEKVSKQKLASVDNFLAHQLQLKNSTADLETRRKFWRRFLVYFVIFVAAAAVFGLYRHFSEPPEEQKVVGTEEYTAWGSTRLPVVYTTAYGHEVAGLPLCRDLLGRLTDDGALIDYA